MLGGLNNSARNALALAQEEVKTSDKMFWEPSIFSWG